MSEQEKRSTTLSRWRSGKEGRAARWELIRMLPRISRGLTALVLVCLALNTALAVLFLLATGALIGAVPPAVKTGLHSPAGAHLMRALVVVAVLFVGEQLLTPIQNLASGSLSRLVDTHLQRRVMAAALAPHTVAHLEDPATLDLVRDAQGIGSGDWGPGAAVEGLRENLSNRLGVLSSAVLVARFHWWLAIVLLAFGAAVRFRIVDDTLRGASWGKEHTPRLRRSDYLRTLALEPDAAKETRIFGLGGWVLEHFSDHWLKAMREIWRMRKKETVSAWAWSIPWGALTLFSLYIAGSAAATGRMDIGHLAVVAQAILGASAIYLSNADVAVAYGAMSVPAVSKLERRAEELRALEAPTTASPDGLPANEISFERVSFRYPGRDTDIFDGFDLRIPAGRSLAIVGRNGAGKTTLIKLLARLHEPSAGRITVDGTDVRDFDARAWQRRITAIFQDYVRYELTARHNVAYGAIELRDDQDALNAAARDAGALDLIEGWPKAWDSVLSRTYKEGVELSGGEWQRIALARALLALRNGAGVLVLDEPTANLDVRAEAEIFDRFLELTQGITTILVSHRFSTVRHADAICVLENGRVVEHGHHDELIAADGRYAHMFRLQAARFTDDDPVGVGEGGDHA